jgi:hypothetical protein
MEYAPMTEGDRITEKLDRLADEIAELRDVLKKE